MGTDTLPAFYSSSSGLPVDICIQHPQQAAQIIAATQRLQAQHGILITVPVPQADALPDEVAENAIQQATDEAHAQGVHGKAMTPFVLSRVAELTKGQSKRANIALLVNNARVAAEIAQALSNL
jgi:pseudouridine-5'-phosphate glycosidase